MLTVKANKNPVLLKLFPKDPKGDIEIIFETKSYILVKSFLRSLDYFIKIQFPLDWNHIIFHKYLTNYQKIYKPLK